MHPMAQAMAAAGYVVYAVDMRGHGASGTKGRIEYVGQLDSDLASFLDAVRPAAPSTLVGFSSGGGFVLRFAGGARRSRFGSYLLLSPFLGQNAPSQRPGSGGWVNVGIARIAALTMLNALGIHLFNHLPVTSFALSGEARDMLTPEYDYNLATNFRPLSDYLANMRSVDRPCAIVAGTEDEAFETAKLESIVRDAGKNWPVRLLPGVKHIPLTLEPGALEAIVQEVGRLQESTS